MRRNVILSDNEIGKATTIGRDDTNDVKLNSPYVSRKHCTIRWINGDPCVNDHSTNGTFVNGSLIPKDCYVKLYDGDVIRIANDTLLVQVRRSY